MLWAIDQWQEPSGASGVDVSSGAPIEHGAQLGGALGAAQPVERTAVERARTTHGTAQLVDDEAQRLADDSDRSQTGSLRATTHTESLAAAAESTASFLQTTPTTAATSIECLHGSACWNRMALRCLKARRLVRRRDACAEGIDLLRAASNTTTSIMARRRASNEPYITIHRGAI